MWVCKPLATCAICLQRRWFYCFLGFVIDEWTQCSICSIALCPDCHDSARLKESPIAFACPYQHPYLHRAFEEEEEEESDIEADADVKHAANAQPNRRVCYCNYGVAVVGGSLLFLVLGCSVIVVLCS